MKIEIKDGEMVLSDVFSGVGIATDMGLFGIAQRDGGIEVLFNGRPAWSSNKLDVLERKEFDRVSSAVRAMANWTPAARKKLIGLLLDQAFESEHGNETQEFESELGNPAAVAQPAARFSEPVRLPDGSGFFTGSFPLPKSHWIYAEEPHERPTPLFSMPVTAELRRRLVAAARFAVRAATMNGTEKDFDPDAMVQNLIVALCGPYGTPNKR